MVSAPGARTTANASHARAFMLLFAVTIFVGAFLLFQVQPLMGKWVLPWFGGGAAIWTTCLLFFQLALLVGYLYAHALSHRFTRRGQARLHSALLMLSLLALWFAPHPEIWKPDASDAPIPRIMVLLLVTIGLPYIMLSSTSPLLQRWFSWSFPGRRPYRLYALSNIGSLLALLSYPVLVEPTLRLGSQVALWKGTYTLFLVLCILCAWRAAAVPPAEAPRARDPAVTATAPPSRGVLWFWLGLSAVGSAMLLATTNQLCQEVAVVPFLWVAPLSLYLLSFIICFDGPRWYDRRVFGALFLLTTPLASEMLLEASGISIIVHIPVYLLVLFVTCMCCHGELVRLKPAPEHLTLFYLVVAAGGALGGLFVAIVAPTWFLGFWEYPISLGIASALILFAWYRDGAWRAKIRRPALIWVPLILFQLLLTTTLVSQSVWHAWEHVDLRRSFYGVNIVMHQENHGDTYRVLRHGRVLHGIQNTRPGREDWATSYYGATTAAGFALQLHPYRLAQPPRPIRAAMLGLGVGTVATYGLPGDQFTFYEIDPNVVHIARESFTFLDRSRAAIEIRLGDGRVQMERALADHPDGALYDVMVFDAFSSDAIPVHLLTREAMETYVQLLNPDGIMAFHLSNRHIDLTSVCHALADHFAYTAIHVVTEHNNEDGEFGATWVVLSRNREFLEHPTVQEAHAPWPDYPPVLWTDDFASLWPLLIW